MPELGNVVRLLAPSFGVDVDARTIEALERHFGLLLRWNAKINLTRIVEAEQVARFHYLESLWLSKLVSPCSRIVDVGSGGGFPGVPLAIVRHEPIVLLEPSVKKATFLRECVRSLALHNVSVVAKPFQAVDICETDVVVSRAVERLESLLPLLLQSSARSVLILTSSEILERSGHERRSRAIVRVPLSDNRLAGRFDRVDSIVQ
jgi:16S rRNA (guanine(527)-N(7))-methyltransferase RsmG